MLDDGIDELTSDYNRAVFQNIARIAQVPYSYIVGLNNGFTVDNTYRTELDLTIKQLLQIEQSYFLGLHDGMQSRSLRKGML